MAIEKFERICRNRKNDMLELGNFIPDFTAPDQDGNIVSSAELLGKKTVVYFYPNILRPALRDAQQKLAA